MPLQGQYTWSERKGEIVVVIPLKGVSAKKVDVTANDTIVKVNYSPYLVEIVLKHKVDPQKQKAQVKNGDLFLTLYKLNEGIWGDLEASGDDGELAELKRQSVVASEVLNEELTSKRSDRKLAEDKFSTRTQMSLDAEERNRVENLKQEEKETAERDVYATLQELQRKEAQQAEKKQQNNKNSATKKSVSFPTSSSQLPITASVSDTTTPSAVINDNGRDIFSFSDTISDADLDAMLSAGDIDADEEIETPACAATLHVTAVITTKSGEDISGNPDLEDQDGSEQSELKYVPPPRVVQATEGGSTTVGISFTPRVFPTPLRESKAAEEEDWVAKNRKHLKKHGVLGKNNSGGDVSEEDPVWLKAKGDDFFRYGDTRSALNAYTAAIDADEHMTTCYSNRAACYLKMNMHHECKEDCTTAIAQLTLALSEHDDADVPLKDSSTTVSTLIKLFIRRGVANCHLGKFSESLSDYRAAQGKYLQLEMTQKDREGEAPNLKGVNKETLVADIKRLELLNSTDLLKREGDLLLSNHELSQAMHKYTEALQLIPFHVSCLTNRGACKYATKDFKGCVDDCSVALEVLRSEGENKEVSATTATATGKKEVKFKELSLGASSSSNVLESILPAVGSEKRTSWTVKTLLKRAMAYVQLAEKCVDNSAVALSLSNGTEFTSLALLDEAVKDYAQASGLDPRNEALRGDLNKLMTVREAKRVEKNNSAAVNQQ